ncbi:MAG: glycine--tRNA ligase subunit beta [Anaerolineales bacterium]
MTITFQDVIMKLHTFWNAQGCVLWQPYNVQVGAGTGNPATLLRVLGPEPWRVAYVEPSIRPDDGRYGENPNRMQMFYQYQVILKPDPGNPQELYLDSLEALGINPREHDLRFVEDNWQSPALGAWGLGWEVWLDGQEITQFTYFQQAGGLTMDPVSVEITYGLERIVSALQGVEAVWDIDFTRGLTYGDMFLQQEIEHCTYYFEIANVDGLRQTYDTYVREYESALAAGLVVPAYDYVLKCSHLFNVLDTRGAIGVTERANFFRQMRNMTQSIAQAYVAQRESLEHPFKQMANAWVPSVLDFSPPADIPAPEQAADFLLEIGTEELPADDVDAALEQLREKAPAFFEDLRLAYDELEIYATPRRLAIIARALVPVQADETEEVKGPPVSVALDDSGAYTKAAEGFARKNGLAAADLQRREMDGGEYLVAIVQHTGRPTPHVLAEALPDFIAGLSFAKTMRWNASGVAFSRPIRWLVALFGDTLIPFSYAQVVSRQTSRGVRPLRSPELTISNADDYLTKLQAQHIILDQDARRAYIQDGATALAKDIGGTIPDDPGLLDEVTNLVEQPTPLRGTFAERFLALPREVLITVMRKHQRYFAVQDAKNDLLPYFIAVRNGDAEHLDIVRAGNEHVLRARFTDAEFFYQADTQKPLQDYRERLGTLTFQEKLGSMLGKNDRLEAMVAPFGELLGAAPDLIVVAQRAAHLAKADLATQMVVEFTSLQGVMGRHYAEYHGEDPAVASAIFEHWLPRSADDVLPTSAAGVLLALLDRLDSLVGLFAAGLAPTGSADPYALRRAALGIVQILLDQGRSLSLRSAVALVAQHQPLDVPQNVQDQVVEFIVGRLRVWFTERDEAHDVIEAVLAEQGHNPARAEQGIQELSAWVIRDDWEPILDAYARCERIIRPVGTVYTADPTQLTDPAEQALYEAFETMRQALTSDYNVGAFLAHFAEIVPQVTHFFDEVMVMAEDDAVRHNRLGLLQAITSLTRGRAEMSQLRGY